MSTFPSSNLAIQTEAFIGSRWVDITGDVRWNSGVRIGRGRGPEGTVATYSRCDFTLDNRSPHPYSPSNPNSTYYGQLGRNVPLRCGIKVMTDDFTRNVSNGWGSATTGQAWSTGGAGGSVLASDFGVTGSAGTHSVPAVSGYRYTTSSGLALRDVYVQVDVSLAITDITGGSVEPATIELRRRSATEYYMARVYITTAEAIQVELLHSTAGTIAAAMTVAGLTHSSSQTLRVGALIEGSTLRIKVWPTTADEPYGWHLEANDDADTTSAGGDVAIRSGISAGNSNALPIVFTYDNLIVRVPRAATEIPSFPIRADISGADVWVPVRSAGIMKRLGQGSPTKQSAYRRFVDQHSPVAYWPMDDGQLIEQAAGLPIGTSPMRPFVGTHPSGAVIGAPRWGRGALAPWLDSVVSRSGSADLTVLWASVRMPGFTNTWSIDHIYASGTNAKDSAVDVNPSYLGGPAGAWPQMGFWPTTLQVVVAMGGLPEVIADVPQLYDNKAHHVRWTATQNGGNVDWFVYVDGVLVNSGSLALTLTAITALGLAATPSADFAQGHITVWTTPPTLADASDAALGYPGEPAGTRIRRICAEEGIPFTCEGDPADSAACGPQYTETVLQVLQDAATADQGELYEPRGTLGIGFRPISATYNQTSALSLGHSAHELSAQLEPAEELFVANDVTATQRDGAVYQAEQTTGPMSVDAPQDGGAGRYRQAITANVHLAGQVKHVAGWLRHLGTTGLPRYKAVEYNLASRELGDSDANLHRGLGVDLHDRLDVTSPPARLQPGTISTLVRNLAERFDQRRFEVTATGEPAEPFEVFRVEDTTRGRLHTAGSALAVAVNTSATALSVATTETPPRPWVTAAGKLPLTIDIGGETMSATTIADELITFVSVGTAAHADNASVAPGLPASIALGDLLLILAAIRNVNASINTPAGYTELYDMGNLRLFGKIATSSESGPTVAFTGGSAGDTTSAQMAAFRGKFYNVSDLITRKTSAINAAAANIAYPGLTVKLPNSLILYLGWKQDDWTSVATIAGATEIGEPSSILGNDQGIVWDYLIQTTAAHIAPASFIVTGGTNQSSIGAVVSLRCDRQAFTVTRSTNGISKSHTAGDNVRLASRHVLAL